MFQKAPPERLSGERILLRRHCLLAAEEMYRLVDADRSRLGRFLPWVAGMHSVADEQEYLRYGHLQWEEGKCFDYGLFRREDDAYLGNLGAHHLDWTHGVAELGYWIGGPFEGRGYVSEAVRLLESELFRLGFHRVEIRCDPANERSAAVPRRLGYQLDGVLRENKVEQGRRRSTLVWSKLASECDVPSKN